jgi:hypothetical protein
MQQLRESIYLTMIFILKLCIMELDLLFYMFYGLFHDAASISDYDRTI